MQAGSRRPPWPRAAGVAAIMSGQIVDVICNFGDAPVSGFGDAHEEAVRSLGSRIRL